ncbi:helix-turn-helix domain-containing protein [Sulfurovum sp.]|uniref:helix-turn-helix domain-containing protein n=1 Tax=Sulfurovum sp. TaxID=1969726 RepID=UPI0025E4F150|nr:helix-turn-helix domain-containing protein [Sulfurovum sp.]
MKKNEKITKVDYAFERIKKVLKVGTYKSCLEYLGIKRGTFDTWKSRGEIPDSKLYKIASKLGVSKEWLEFDDGVMLAGEGQGAVRDQGRWYGHKEIVLPYYSENYASACGSAFNGFDASSPVSISRDLLQSYFGISAAKGQHPITKEYTFICDNPDVADITFIIDESSDCKFIGRVVGSMGVV